MRRKVDTSLQPLELFLLCSGGVRPSFPELPHLLDCDVGDQFDLFQTAKAEKRFPDLLHFVEGVFFDLASLGIAIHLSKASSTETNLAIPSASQSRTISCAAAQVRTSRDFRIIRPRNVPSTWMGPWQLFFFLDP
jgi:hypothetical protein